MKRLELAEQLRQFYMELCRYWTISCQIVSTDRVLLENVTRVYYVSKLFDQLDLVFQDVKIKRNYVDQEWSSEVVSRMALTPFFNLSPLVAFPVKESLIWNRINLRTVKHLSMDQAKTFQGNNNHVAVKLAYGDHEGSRHTLIRYQNIDYVAKSKL